MQSRGNGLYSMMVWLSCLLSEVQAPEAWRILTCWSWGPGAWGEFLLVSSRTTGRDSPGRHLVGEVVLSLIGQYSQLSHHQVPSGVSGCSSSPDYHDLWGRGLPTGLSEKRSLQTSRNLDGTTFAACRKGRSQSFMSLRRERAAFMIIHTSLAGSAMKFRLAYFQTARRSWL